MLRNHREKVFSIWRQQDNFLRNLTILEWWNWRIELSMNALFFLWWLLQMRSNLWESMIIWYLSNFKSLSAESLMLASKSWIQLNIKFIGCWSICGMISTQVEHGPKKKCLLSLLIMKLFFDLSRQSIFNLYKSYIYLYYIIYA